MPSFVYAAFALVFVSVPAGATAMASVPNAFWQADFAWYDDGTTRITHLPAGVAITCTGTAVADGALGCRDNAWADVASSDGLWRSHVVDRFGALLLNNIGAAPLGGVFAFTTRFGSFYPALPDTGARVADGARETAGYFSVVSGAGGFDLQGCSMMSAPGHSGPETCRPSPPEFQESVFMLTPPGAWRDLAADWRIYIQVMAQGQKNAGDPVNEPPALFLAALGLLLTGCRRKAR